MPALQYNKMSSHIRRSRIFHRYHQAPRHRDENRHREGDVDVDGMLLTPTRRTAYLSPTKLAASKTTAAGRGIDRTMSPNPNDRVVDDLTLGYHASPRQRRFATERNPTEYETSPASARSFRIISLDGCYEEQVSPLLTDAYSSSSASSYQIRDDPTVQATPRFVMTKKDVNAKNSKTITTRISLGTVANGGVCSENKGEVMTITPPGAMKRTRNSHNRSQFVFDGNLSFEDISPIPMYATSPTLAHSFPPRTSFTGLMVMHYPPTTATVSMTPMTPMTPVSPQPYAFDSIESNNREQQQKQGRSTPPPTHQEQRRRNKAMPSVQYDNLLFNQLWQEQVQTGEEQLQR